MKYQCPVCGYPDMDDPPTNWNICSCCGTEFEYDDCNVFHEELRLRWIAAGARWFSHYTPAPPEWSATGQLAAAGFDILSPQAGKGTDSGFSTNSNSIRDDRNDWINGLCQ